MVDLFQQDGQLSSANGGTGGASGLESERSADAERSATAPVRVIAVTSGKGGVGKSVLSANLGLALAQRGRKVLMVDADLALANLDLMLGMNARSTVKDVLSNERGLEEVVVSGPEGVCLLPACSGDADLAEMDERRRLTLFNAIDAMEGRFDTVIVDTGAGIGSNATSFAAAAQQVLVVVTPDPASMADAYAMIKTLAVKCGVKQMYLAVNMASGPKEAEQVLGRLLGLVDRFLDVSVVPVGFIYRDEAVLQSVRSCQPLLVRYPAAAVSGAIRGMAGRLLAESPSESGWGGPRLFWKRLMGLAAQEAVL
ncbi:MAG: MinD/ParA family protein [Deltaproteobacteria bacterium]|nr:MinD/ParA family protein [Deltaproteobacteria bacterium]